MPFTSAVFYRHWLEIRGGLVFLGIVTSIASLIAFAALMSSAGSGQDPFALSTHAWMTAIVALLAAIVVTGSGIRTNGFQPGHTSLQYTLTLPVSRSAWILTRFAAGLAGTIAPVAVLLVVDVVGFLVAGNDPPIGRMLHASVTIGLVAVLAGAVCGILLPIWRDWMQTLGATAIFVGMVLYASNALNDYSLHPGWPRPIVALLESPPDALVLTGATVLIVAGLVSLAVAIARRQDF
jgi:hypothetical protein